MLTTLNELFRNQFKDDYGSDYRFIKTDPSESDSLFPDSNRYRFEIIPIIQIYDQGYKKKACALDIHFTIVDRVENRSYDLNSIGSSMPDIGSFLQQKRPFITGYKQLIDILHKPHRAKILERKSPGTFIHRQ